MNEHASLADITFTENGYVDLAQLNALYRYIGWDSQNRRTEAGTTEMLRVSHYYIAAHTADRTLVGFARVCGDPYVAQVLDVITHPDYRRRGIATRCMHGVLAHLQRSHYVSVTLTDGSGIAGFYQRFGFRVCKDVVQRWERGTETISTETDSERSSAPERTRGGVMLFGLGGYLKMTVAVGDFQSGSPRVIPEAPVVKTALVDR